VVTSHGLREAEVRHAHAAIVANEHVLRLEVAVDAYRASKQKLADWAFSSSEG